MCYLVRAPITHDRDAQGDGDAAQGDGELNGNALGTSMDVEFTVEVLHDKQIRTPRVESDSQIMTVGLGRSL
jgi:amidase